jgi:hypothetical protein
MAVLFVVVEDCLYSGRIFLFFLVLLFLAAACIDQIPERIE